MKTQNKTVVGAVETKTGVRESKMTSWDLVLRLSAFALTLAAAIVLGVDKQSTFAAFQLSANLPALNVPVTAKWHYLSAFVFAFVSNCIATSYAAVSLLILVRNKNGKRGSVELIVMVVDLMMIALLFSGNGAAMAIGLMGYKGNSHVRWNKVCNIVGRFCNQVAASVALSLLGSLAFVFLVVISAFSLHKKANY